MNIEFFCDSLVILVKGEPILQGKLTKIKNDFKRKNIKVIADLDKVCEEYLNIEER